jgi:hypothetical protein
MYFFALVMLRVWLSIPVICARVSFDKIINEYGMAPQPTWRILSECWISAMLISFFTEGSWNFMYKKEKKDIFVNMISYIL